MQTIAIFGAAGNIGTRLSNRLTGTPGYRVLYVEKGEAANARLRERGHPPTPAPDAIAGADIAILAVPDTHIGPVGAEVVPGLRSGALVMCLDPAAPYAGKLPERDDVSYFVTHPAHPPIFNDETDPEARRDYFGSGLARQAIVNALMQGPEEDYARGEAVARLMWGPVLRSHRITLEQMALLEPALSETVALSCVVMMREALDEVVARGVPREAAVDFMLGHLNIELAIYFDQIDWEVSEGAKKMLQAAQKQLFQPDWKRVFEPEAVKKSVRQIVGDEPLGA